jgi:hypothetical protein
VEHDGVDPDLPVEEGVPDELHLELVGATVVVEVKTLNSVAALGLGKELGCVGVVVHDPERSEGDNNGGDTLENENPALEGSAWNAKTAGSTHPALITGRAIHEVNETGEETTEGTGGGGGGEEESNAESDLVATVPLREEVGDTGEEAGLGGTEEDTSDEETLKVLDEAHTSHDTTPGDHDDREPHGRTPGLHDHVGRDLTEDVEHEEDAEAGGVVGRVEVDVDGKAEQVGVTDVGTVQEREKVEKGKPRDEVEVAGLLVAIGGEGGALDQSWRDSQLAHKALVVDLLTLDLADGVAARDILHGVLGVSGIHLLVVGVGVVDRRRVCRH